MTATKVLTVIAALLAIVSPMAGTILYAENTYQKQETSKGMFKEYSQQIQKDRIDRFQTEIDLLEIKKEYTGALPADEAAKLRYYINKRNNAQKEFE